MVNHVMKVTKISYLLTAKFGNCWQYSFWLCSFFRMCRIEPACQIEIIFYLGFSQQLCLFEKFVKILRQWPNIYQIIFQTRWFKGCFIEFNLYSKKIDGVLEYMLELFLWWIQIMLYWRDKSFVIIQMLFLRLLVQSIHTESIWLLVRLVW